MVEYLERMRKFQFLIGTIKTGGATQFEDSIYRFQFLIGTIKTRKLVAHNT